MANLVNLKFTVRQAPGPGRHNSQTKNFGIRSRSAIRFSASCSSVQSTDTMNAERKREDDPEDNDDDDHEAGVVEVSSPDSGPEGGDDDAAFTEGASGNEAAAGEKGNADYSREVVQATHQRSLYTESTGAEAVIVPETIVVEKSKDIDLQTAPPTGAETASEIFRHLQATRDKDEVTTELAKILNVLESTLQQEDESDDDEADEESEDASDSEKENEGEKSRVTEHESAEPMIQGAELTNTSDHRPVPSPGVTKKPPKHPNPRRASRREAVVSKSEGGRAKSGKEEMGILSKILVTLLCSCKSAAASGELKRVIRQFREAAREATDEVGEDIKGRSSKTRAKRSLRHRDEMKFKSTVPKTY